MSAVAKTLGIEAGTDPDLADMSSAASRAAESIKITASVVSYAGKNGVTPASSPSLTFADAVCANKSSAPFDNSRVAGILLSAKICI